jgi:HlyD family secretion protein
MFRIIRRPLVSIPLILLILVAVIVFFSKGDTTLPGDVATASRSNLIQTVSVTGRVVAADEASLAFERGGKISAVPAYVSKKVSQGDVLVRLENTELLASLLQAQAGEKGAQATLAEVTRGSRPEEISIAEAKVSSSERAYADARQSLVDSIRQAYTYADDAVRNKADQLFTNPQSSAPALSIAVSDFQLKTDIESSRFSLNTLLNEWKGTVNMVTADDSNVFTFAKTSVAHATKVRLFIDKLSLAVNALTTNANVSQTTIDSYKASVATARNNLNTAIDGLNTALAGINTAESNLTVARGELVLKRAGSTAEAVTTAEAKVDEAKAAVLNAEAALAKTFIRAPFAGLVTKVDAVTGEIASANSPVVWMIGAGEFEIEANIPEADIAKLSIGDVATTTLDAYGSDVSFVAQVTNIDPAETLVDNVATYKVTLRFLAQDVRIKSGMTANIDILTESKENVLAVPVRAVSTRSNGAKYVLVVDGQNGTTERTVEVGIRAEGGLVEIISGLSEGEVVSLSR